MTPDDPRHGTTRGYHAGCHDLCCRRAMARYEKAGRLARLRGGRAVPAQGAQRRLQALMAIGWSSNAIAERAGLAHRNHVWRIVNGQKGKPTVWIRKDTDEWVRRIYDELSMVVPEGRYVARTKAHAAKKGWAPPLAWNDIDTDDNPRGVGWKPRVEGDRYRGHDYDETVVERILGGDYNTPSTPVEKTAVCARWVAMGRSLNELERRTGWRAARYWKGDAA